VATYLDLERLGQAPDQAAWLSGYPHLAKKLSEFLDDHTFFQSVAPSLAPRSALPWNPRHATAITVLPTAVPVAVAPRIDTYTLLGELGRGGMGVVYKAAQEGLNRLVALKMVLDNSLGSEAYVRFKAEAQVVARLKHPNIVPIYDVGIHQGRPYFALEFVDGGTLAQQIAGQPQPARQAAALVETLARAMDYAHQAGIVHRDLKPGNILLAMDGTPKITDFGLAKQLQGKSTDTKTGAILGTPSYIAPEQAAGKKDVGPPADIYALGAILYEMLSGRPPFKGETPMDTMLQVVSEEVVPPRWLNARVPADLETICLKCLHKEPAKRYGSAAALADDLHRFQSGEPITARPVGVVEKAWRWCRRRPGVAALLVLLIVVTVSGVAGICWQWQHARSNAAEAEQQRERAEKLLETVRNERNRIQRDYEQARQIIDDFFVRISDQNLRNVPGYQNVRRDFLESALKYYRGFLQQHRDDPSLQFLVAEARYNIGKVVLEIGQLQDADREFREALRVQKELLAAHPSDRKLKRAVADTLVGVAHVLTRQQRLSQAEDAYSQARVYMEELVRTARNKDEGLEALLFIYDGVGTLRRSEGKREAALRSYEDGCALLRKLIASEATLSRMWKLAILCTNRGEIYKELKQLDRARAVFHEGRLLLEPVIIQAKQRRPDLDASLAHLYVRLAELPPADEKADDRLDYLGKARVILERVARENPAVPSYRGDLAAISIVLGEVYLVRNQVHEALASYDQARSQWVALVREDVASVPYRQNLVLAHLGCARARLAAGQIAAARTHYADAQKVQEQLVRSHPDVPAHKQRLDSILQDAAKAQAKQEVP
jgi:serine/threonine protein kinase